MQRLSTDGHWQAIRMRHCERREAIPPLYSEIVAYPSGAPNDGQVNGLCDQSLFFRSPVDAPLGASALVGHIILGLCGPWGRPLPL